MGRECWHGSYPKEKNRVHVQRRVEWRNVESCFLELNVKVSKYHVADRLMYITWSWAQSKSSHQKWALATTDKNCELFSQLQTL